MKVDVSASVCASWDAVRISVENGVTVARASKAGLRGPMGYGTAAAPGPPARARRGVTSADLPT
ncbi:hypothetical protein GCM10023237_48650 [Streptomyces coeruleoprunus]